MKYIIYSGWWCDESSRTDQRDVYLGDDTLRTSAFHDKWFQCIDTYTNPDKVLIIDSASPVKPNYEGKGIEFLSLDKNYGHSTNHTGLMCGVTRAHLMGVYYAYLCDADYCVYIEQDAVIKGDGIVEYAISKMTKPYMFGTGKGTPYATQQSFFVIRKDGYIPFINRMSKIKSSCNKIAPENKFAIASSRFLSLLPEFIFKLRGIGKVLRYWPSFNIVPFGYGRTRPIDFSSQYMYFQHGSNEELEQFDKSL
ncbi:hypothetical protein MZK14_001569 [Vibrio parahaemolyticus]|uniref:hypothetical protein n=1 Tax=Vibrio harveyi TaxID=669 RepID=UPI0005EF4F33|nr:hypothetical protein [Vibrio harveyi]EGQ8705418.1 hypothetical protein [Vibrio parahaemolyticus]EGR3461893.1 hypothetical protein [Vibrio parahaemolyticus]EJC7184294.1 hypothetical protein [Vibrio parahaemolyticus]EJG0062310.1 hypothetical protein [Vibrio parahaemolyticus]EJG0452170.1 hypothetical protein [Vibrio parahaemolyticus]